jgi:histidine ammonia-lyase
LLNAAQAIEFRRPMKTSMHLETLLADYRAVVPSVTNDRVLHEDIIKSAQFIQQHKQ